MSAIPPSEADLWDVECVEGGYVDGEGVEGECVEVEGELKEIEDLLARLSDGPSTQQQDSQLETGEAKYGRLVYREGIYKYMYGKCTGIN